MLSIKIIGRVVCTGVLLVVTPCAAAGSLPGTISAAERDAIRKQAALHADQTGVSEEAVRRTMLMQAGGGYVIERILSEFKSRYATGYRVPPDRLVVRLKGDEPVPGRSYPVGNDFLKVDFIPGARHTKDDLLEAMVDMRPQLEQLVPSSVGGYVDERTGEVVIFTETWSKAESEAMPKEILGIPVRVDVLGESTGYRDFASESLTATPAPAPATPATPRPRTTDSP